MAIEAPIAVLESTVQTAEPNTVESSIPSARPLTPHEVAMIMHAAPLDLRKTYFSKTDPGYYNLVPTTPGTLY